MRERIGGKRPRHRSDQIASDITSSGILDFIFVLIPAGEFFGLGSPDVVGNFNTGADFFERAPS